MKTAKTVLCMLMVIALSITSVMFVGRNESQVYAEEETIEIGILMQNSSENKMTVSYLKSYLNYDPDDEVEYIFHEKYYDDYSRIDQQQQYIEELSDIEGISIILIETLNTYEIIDSINMVYEKGIKIIIYGPYEPSCPKETIFIVHDYYSLGVSHAIDVCNYPLNDRDDNLMYVFYYDDNDGNAYKEGISTGLAEYNYHGQVEFEKLPCDVNALADTMLKKKVEYVITYDSYTALSFLYNFFVIGLRSSFYGDAVIGVGYIPQVGTGDSFDIFLKNLGEIFADAITSVISGGQPNDSTNMDGNYIVYAPFISGDIQYLKW